MRFFSGVLVVACFLSCSPAAQRCDASCAGCCDSTGACQAGVSPLACGAQGSACQSCAPGATCTLGQCNVSSGSGGGTGVGGGSGGGGGGGSIACAGTLQACSQRCVDTDTDDSNCGRCGAACTGGTVCTRGACALLPTDCSTQSCPLGYGCDPATLKCTPGCRVTPDCPAAATCVGGKCACDTGKHACGQLCVSDTAPTSCGSSCTACPSAPNADATCTAGSCGLACRVGFHLCGGQCVSNAAIASCGGACTPCATPANGVATCTNQACGRQCNPGFHDCSGACVSDAAPATCGNQCTACTTPGHGAATCTGGACGVSCDTTFHACGVSCASDLSPQSCGTLCTPCPGTANGSATCVGGACALGCDSGFHLCTGACASNNAVSSCGAGCTACPQGPANSTPSCDGVACGFTCNANFSRCGSACCFAFTRISIGDALTCGLTSTGGVKCWGGSLNTTLFGNSPTDLSGLTSGVDDVSVGSRHLCVVTQGLVKCVGANDFLQSGGVGARNTPTTVAGITGATRVSAGFRYSCAVAGGQVYCWGTATNQGLGGTPTSSGAVVVVPGITTAVEVDVGTEHTCALLSTGTVQCWGANAAGELGAIDYVDSVTPRTVVGLSGVTSLALGRQHTCAVTGGAVKCWGYGGDGQLDGVSRNATNTPLTPVASGVSKVGTRSYDGTCAVRTNGTAVCWGSNLFGQIGNGVTSTAPTAPTTVMGLSSVVSITQNAQLGCAVTANGTGYCWGRNSYGGLGDGTTTDRTTPVEVLRP